MVKIVGKYNKQLYEFATRNPNWTTFRPDALTKRNVFYLKKKGLLDVDVKNNMFKLRK